MTQVWFWPLLLAVSVVALGCHLLVVARCKSTRCWSVGHSVAATLMIAMLVAPMSWQSDHHQFGWFLTEAGCAFSLVTLAFIGSRWLKEGRIPWVGLMVLVDLIAMAYMTTPSLRPTASVTIALSALLGAESLAWLVIGKRLHGAELALGTRSLLAVRVSTALMAAAMVSMLLAGLAQPAGTMPMPMQMRM